jgi:hypothetical protein
VSGAFLIFLGVFFWFYPTPKHANIMRFGTLVGAAVGASMLRSNRLRKCDLVVSADAVTGMRWGLLQDHPLTTPLSALYLWPQHRVVGERVELLLGPSGKAVAYWVPRAAVAELQQRISLRVQASLLEAPKASEVLELYLEPGSKPLGVAYMDETWQAFTVPEELLSREKARSYRDHRVIKVFAHAPDFDLLVQAAPELNFERVAIPALSGAS